MKKFPIQEKVFLYRYLAQALSSGLWLAPALKAYLADVHPRHRKILAVVLAGLGQGQPWWQALARSKGFSFGEILIFKHLAEKEKKYKGNQFWRQPGNYSIFQELFKFFHNELKWRKKVRSLLFYPSFLFLFLLVVLFIYLFCFLPKITPLADKLHLKLPVLLEFLWQIKQRLNFSIWLNNWPYLLIFLSAVWLVWIGFALRPIKFFFGRLFWRAPFLSRLIRIKLCAEVSFYLFLLSKISISLNSKEQPLRKAGLNNILQYLPAVISSPYGRELWRGITRRVGQGGKISDAWQGNNQQKKRDFPLIFRRLVEIGEKNNSLPQEFKYAYKILQQELEIESKFTLSFLEPIFIWFIAGLLGWLALSIYFMFNQIYGKIVF